jgi:hypothetical protein
VTSTPAQADGSLLEQLALEVSSLVLQRHGSDCWIASPVIVTLRYPGVQNAKSEGERESSDDDYPFGHHGNPLDFLGHVPCIPGIQPPSVMAITNLANAGIPNAVPDCRSLG